MGMVLFDYSDRSLDNRDSTYSVKGLSAKVT